MNIMDRMRKILEANEQLDSKRNGMSPITKETLVPVPRQAPVSKTPLKK